MRIADFTGVIYGASRKMQVADGAKASVSFCMTLCGIALNQAKIADLLIDKATKMCYNYIVISSLKTALAISY